MARATADVTLPPGGSPIQTRHEICIATARTCCMYVCIFIYQQPSTIKIPVTNLYKHK